MDYKKIDKEVKDLINKYRVENNRIRDIEFAKFIKVKDSAEEIKYKLFQDVTYNNNDWKHKPIEFNYNEYIFCSFKDSKFGKTAVLREEDMYHAVQVHFWNVTFNNCVFENVYFNASWFWGCKFINCSFKEFGVIFDNCVFRHMTMEQNAEGSHESINVSTEFVSCNISGTRFRNSIGANMIFQDNTFILSSFTGCEMEDCIFDGNAFYSTVINNSNIFNLNIINMKHPDIEFHFTSREKDTNLHKKIYVSKMDNKYITNEKDDYRILVKMYYTLLEYLQKKNLDTENMSEYRFLYNYYSMLSKEHFWEQMWERISWLICGFGEKMGWLFRSFIIIILFPAIGYMFTGINVGNSIIKYTFVGGTPVGIIQIIKDFGMCLHFSIVTFSTVGYGNITPYGAGSYFISALQIITGIIFLATFTSVILKRILK